METSLTQLSVKKITGKNWDVHETCAAQRKCLTESRRQIRNMTLKRGPTNPTYRGVWKLMGRHPLSKTTWYSIRLNSDKVCWSDPERDATRCLGNRRQARQHAPPKPPGDSWCNPTSMADLQAARRGCAPQTSPQLPLLFPPPVAFLSFFFFWIHVIAVYFYPFPSPANRESPVDS